MPGASVEFGVQCFVVRQLAEDIVQHCDFTLHCQLWKIKKEAMTESSSNESEQELANTVVRLDWIACIEVRALVKPRD